jgi:hypothetical protein
MEHGRIKMSWTRIKLFLPVLLGALGGFLYYNFIGCNGGCAITGSPVNSTLYGSLMGLILTDWKQVKLLFIKKEEQK